MIYNIGLCIILIFLMILFLKIHFLMTKKNKNIEELIILKKNWLKKKKDTCWLLMELMMLSGNGI